MKFQSGLEDVLRTGNITYYPAICAEATASFAVLSDVINCIIEILVLVCTVPDDNDNKNDDNTTTNSNNRKNIELHKLLQNLQKHECNKLNYTAAYHLERIRGSSSEQPTTTNGDNNNNNNNNNTSTTERLLLQQGAQSLQIKITTCIENINEILDEIRSAIIDEDEEE